MDPKEVRRARLKELGYIHDKEVWVTMTRAEAKKRGYRIVGVRWIDINKGDSLNPEFRSRLVAKDFNNGKEEGIFAATPPLEALKYFISEAATVEKGKKHNKIIMINDVARAFFEADAKRPLCVELPDEAREERKTA